MTTATKPKSGYERWQDTINNAVGDAKWNAYDCEIQTAVNEINRHLSGTPGYSPLDWRLIKAMTWVESGAENKKWKSRPIQIGNTGDPGFDALLSNKEGGDLILPPTWKSHLNHSNVIAFPTYNLRAGISYLLMKMAHFSIQRVDDTDRHTYKVTVEAGDTLERIAKTHGSTVEVLKKLNPRAHTLHPGQVLEYRKAVVKKVIVGWRPVTTLGIAMYYNGGGDPLYAKKLDYAMTATRKGKSAVCH